MNRWLPFVASGTLLTRIVHDPLLAAKPDPSAVSVFTVTPDERVLYFVAAGGTLEDLDRAAEEKVEREAAEREQARRWREKQRQVPVLLQDIDRRYSQTLREAGRVVTELGGRISVGKFGELALTLPERLTRPEGGFADGFAEQEARQHALAACDVLAAGWRVVLACRRRLLRTPSLGQRSIGAVPSW